MKRTWIVVANASMAYIYAPDLDAFAKHKIQLELIKELSHPESRQKDGDLISDRSGHFYSGSTGHGSYNNATNPKQHEAEVFAKQIAEELNAARNANLFDQLYLFTPAHFHGLLNKQCNKHLLTLIAEHYHKDYTKLPVLELQQHIHNHLFDETN